MERQSTRQKGGHSSRVAVLSVPKKPTGHCSVESLSVPEDLRPMGPNPRYLKFPPIVLSWASCYAVNMHCLHGPSPPHCPSLNDIELGLFMYFDQQNVIILYNDLPVPSRGLNSFAVFSFDSLGVANSAMKRTGPGKPLIQGGKTSATNRKATCSLKQSHPSLIANL